MDVEVSKIWNLLMGGINDALSSKLTEDEIGNLLKIISPLTIEFSSSLAKATMVNISIFYYNCYYYYYLFIYF